LDACHHCCYHERCLAVRAAELARRNPSALVRVSCFSKAEADATRDAVPDDVIGRVTFSWLTSKEPLRAGDGRRSR
jgi:hypothetical protein